MKNFIQQKIISLLRYSEKYTRTDMVYLARVSFWMNFEQVLTGVVGFVLSIAFANFITPETYSKYTYLMSIFSILTFFQLPGIGMALVRSVSQGHEETVFSAILYKIKWSFLGSGIGFLVMMYYWLHGNNELAFGMLIVSIFLPIVGIFSIYNSYLNGKKYFGAMAVTNILISFISSGIQIVILFIFQNIFILLFINFFVLSVLQIITFIRVIKKFPPKKSIDPGALKYGKYLTFIKTLVTVTDHLDKILIWHFLGPLEVAIYSFAIIPAIKLKGVIGNFKSLALPKLSKADPEVIRKTLPIKIYKFFILLVPIVILYILTVPYFYKIFYPQYMESIFYSQIFSLSLLFVPFLLYGSFFTAFERKDAITFTSIVIPIIQILLSFTLLYFFGLIGIIVIPLIEGIIHALGSHYYFHKSFKYAEK